MPSRRAVIVSSCEPWASARSKSRGRAHLRSACSRACSCRALPGPRPAAVVADHRCLHAVRLDQLDRLRVVARGDLDLVALLAQQLDERPEDERVRARRHVDPDLHATSRSSGASRRMPSTWCSYQSVSESSPQSCRELSRVPAACSSRSRVAAGVLQEALPGERLGGERLSRERQQLPAQPRCGGNREAALAAVHDRVRQQRLDRLPQQPLLRQAADLVPHRQREGEVRDDRVHERHARLERPGHRGAVGLHEQVVDEVGAEVDVLQAGQQLVALGLGKARPVAGERVGRVRGGPSARPGARARRSPSSRDGARAGVGAPRGRSAWP